MNPSKMRDSFYLQLLQKQEIKEQHRDGQARGTKRAKCKAKSKAKGKKAKTNDEEEEKDTNIENKGEVEAKAEGSSPPKRIRHKSPSILVLITKFQAQNLIFFG